MTIAKGRNLQVDGETFVWRLSKVQGRYNGTCGPTASFTAQHGSRQGLLTAKHWTKEHECFPDMAPAHKVSFTPKDAKVAIEVALEAEGGASSR